MCWDWSDERVELYLRNLLTAKENKSFEQHLLSCAHCQERIDDEVNVLLALRRAALASAVRHGRIEAFPAALHAHV